jgi:hypothetical protein
MKRHGKRAVLAATAALGLLLAGCDGEPSAPGTQDAGSDAGSGTDGGTNNPGTGTLSGQLAFTPASVLFARVADNHAIVLYTDVSTSCAALTAPNTIPRPYKSVSLNLYNSDGGFSRAEDIEEPYPYYTERLADGGTGLSSEGDYVRSLSITHADGNRYAGNFAAVNMLDGSGRPAYGTLSGTFDARVCP